MTKDVSKDINLAPVLRRADIDIHQINLYPVDSAIFCFFVDIYALNSVYMEKCCQKSTNNKSVPF